MKSEKPIVCKLTAPELQQRKQTVIAQLKSLVVGRIEESNAVTYRFVSTDEMIDLLTEFIKTERLCCPFLTFGLTIDEDKISLKLSGPKGTPEFLRDEIGF